MEITEIRVKLTDDLGDRLKAFCSITLEGRFVIRDLKIIEGPDGLFVAMPSRKLADHCPRCGGKNHLRARFCNECGLRLNEDRARRDPEGRAKLHADIAHPINAGCREEMQTRILEAFEAERHKARQPGYRPPRLYDEDPDIEAVESRHAPVRRPVANARSATAVSSTSSPTQPAGAPVRSGLPVTVVLRGAAESAPLSPGFGAGLPARH